MIGLGITLSSFFHYFNEILSLNVLNHDVLLIIRVMTVFGKMYARQRRI